MAYNDKKGDLVWITCLTCKGNTEHKIVESFSTGGAEPYNWSTNYEILTCNGCKAVTFRISGSDEDSWNGEEYQTAETFYPSRKAERSSSFGHMRWRNPRIPREVHSAYNEVISAMNNSLPLLAAVGIRLMVEGICRKERCARYCKKQGKPDNLKNQIDTLIEKQVITGRQAKVLHKMRFLGNNAAHEILAPTEEELSVALDITELMIRTIYLLDGMGNRITSTLKSEKRERRWASQKAKKRQAASVSALLTPKP